MFTLYVVCCQLYYFYVSLIYSEYLANAVERDAHNGRVRSSIRAAATEIIPGRQQCSTLGSRVGWTPARSNGTERIAAHFNL